MWSFVEESKFPNKCCECGKKIEAGQPVYLTKDPEFSPGGKWIAACPSCHEAGIKPKTVVEYVAGLSEDFSKPMPGGDKMPSDVDALTQFLKAIDDKSKKEKAKKEEDKILTEFGEKLKSSFEEFDVSSWEALRDKIGKPEDRIEFMASLKEKFPDGIGISSDSLAVSLGLDGNDPMAEDIKKRKTKKSDSDPWSLPWIRMNAEWQV